MKTTQLRMQSVYSELNYSKGVSHHCLCLAKKQRQAREWKSFRVEKKRASFRYSLTGIVHMVKLETGKLEAVQLMWLV